MVGRHRSKIERPGIMSGSIKERSANILHSQKINASSIQPLPGGRNNQVFKVSYGNRELLLKSYFWHEHDQRNRLGAEYSFIEYAVACGIDVVAKPVAKDENNQVALYHFIQGRKLEANQIDATIIRQAIAFLGTLNQHKENLAARKLGIASDACFTYAHHLDTVQKRLETLRNIEPEDDTDREMLQYLDAKLVPKFSAIREDIEKAISAAGDKPMDEEFRILSPSDFGFHNALIDSKGIVYFLDFEYAGWDDPAKTVGDFFNQVHVPVPLAFLDEFVAATAQLTPDAAFTERRIRCLLPLYSMKWICIVLNFFLPVHRERRKYARVDDSKRNQLNKAIKIFKERLE